jgi:hypothetical protein
MWWSQIFLPFAEEMKGELSCVEGREGDVDHVKGVH